MHATPAPDAIVSTIRIGATMDDISRATQWIQGVGEAGGWPASQRFGLELSLEEALTNVVSYGFPKAVADGGVEPRIVIACYLLPERRVGVRIIDNGIAFDPTAVPEPATPHSIEEARIGGHGVQLMRHFLESLEYAREGDENHLLLVAAPGEDEVP